jgi:hypothetical protein
MKMNDIVGRGAQKAPQANPRRNVERVSDPHRKAPHAGRLCAIPQFSIGVAKQVSASALTDQLARQAEDLAFAAGEGQLRIDADDAQGWFLIH